MLHGMSPEALLDILRGFLGIAVFTGIAVLLSENRRAISWRVVGVGLVLQFVFAALVLYAPPARWAIDGVGAEWR
jgi:CNT family concentrative nucleoside transporter